MGDVILTPEIEEVIKRRALKMAAEYTHWNRKLDYYQGRINTVERFEAMIERSDLEKVPALEAVEKTKDHYLKLKNEMAVLITAFTEGAKS